MGVMLSLEGDKPARARRRRGQHTRTTEDQARLDALAAFLRSDATSAGRSLSRVSRAALAARLLPATWALAQAASTVLAEPPDGGRSVEFDLAISPACLLGMCTGSAAGNPGTTSPCSSPDCQHSCHRGPRTQTYSVGIAGYPGQPGLV
jgi:hypothetical protein